MVRQCPLAQAVRASHAARDREQKAVGRKQEYSHVLRHRLSSFVRLKGAING